MTRRERWGVVAAVGTALVLLVWGWKLFWFLTDDAFIAFRYVSNSRLSFGYVWNPPPFMPVEGYTSFLWVAVLDGCWRLFGVAPPQSANWISLGFAVLTLLLAAVMLWRIRWRPSLARARVGLLFLGLLGIVSNRTFLAWSSSGLETAMFNFFVAVWIFALVFVRDRPRARLALASAAAGALALTRPDGLLYAAATSVAALIAWRGPRPRLSLRQVLIAILPLLVVPTHLLWRHSFYGAWLPNTYYAKFTAPWPQSGVRYLASFVLEYALWIWLAAGVVAVVLIARGRGRGLREMPTFSPATLLVLLTLLAHVGYYILVIGGDHFEYRVLSHLIVPLWVSAVWMANRLAAKPRAATLALAGFLLFSLPVPWTHWARSHRYQGREETLQLFVPVADHLPWGWRGYGATFDRLQDWLISHFVCIRHQEHKVALDWWFRDVIPTREQGARVGAEGYPVMVAAGGIGGLAWVLPRVNFIDLYGLSDYVVARAPTPPGERRWMAHERVPPEGYVESFRPNVRLVVPHGVEVTPRAQPLTAQEIRASEAAWRAHVGEAAQPRHRR